MSRPPVCPYGMFALTGEHEFFDLFDLAAERLVGLDEVRHGLARVEHRGVVAASDGRSDRRERGLGVSPEVACRKTTCHSAFQRGFSELPSASSPFRKKGGKSNVPRTFSRALPQTSPEIRPLSRSACSRTHKTSFCTSSICAHLVTPYERCFPSCCRPYTELQLGSI